MKRLLKAFVLAITLVLMTGCSAQYRAQRHLRRAIELCPELIQIQSHSIDTVLVAPGYQDIIRVPMENVFKYDTLFLDTDHGTVSLSFDQTDSTITVGFTADPTEIHYQDTANYSQVKMLPSQDNVNDLGSGILVCIICIGFGMVLALWLLRNVRKN